MTCRQNQVPLWYHVLWEWARHAADQKPRQPHGTTQSCDDSRCTRMDIGHYAPSDTRSSHSHTCTSRHRDTSRYASSGTHLSCSHIYTEGHRPLCTIRCTCHTLTLTQTAITKKTPNGEIAQHVIHCAKVAICFLNISCHLQIFKEKRIGWAWPEQTRWSLPWWK